MQSPHTCHGPSLGVLVGLGGRALFAALGLDGLVGSGGRLGPGLDSSGTQNPWPMARRPVSRHTRAEAVDTGCQRDIPVL